jgi:hypothetical protein
MLASAVRDQWSQEAARRELNRPFPLQVRWSSTSRQVAAGREAVLGDSNEAEWREYPLSGDANEIVTAFLGLPYQQLVILGEPGAGKTVLAILLILGLLKRPSPGDPVPVLIPIASWNPHTELPQEFALRRLREEYRFLSARAKDGCSLAELLAASGKVLLVFDGLDELPDERHVLAIEALDQFAATGKPLIVTCRSREYEQAVMRSGHVLSRSAVIEIEPVQLESAIKFLSQPAPAQRRWQPVFDHLLVENQGSLAQTLSTPLMVTLARTAYRAPSTDPVELLELPDARSIAEALIEGFIKSVYNTDLPNPASFDGQRLRADDADNVRRWLACLACHLLLAITPDFWWWQLSPGLLAPPPRPRTSWIKTLAVCTGVTAIILASILTGIWSIVWAFGTLTVIFISSKAGVFRIVWPDGYPPYRPRRDRGQCHVEELVRRGGMCGRS